MPPSYFRPHGALIGTSIGGASLQTNNLINLIASIVFTLGVIIVGLPASIYFLKKGLEGFKKFGFAKFPKNFMPTTGLGRSFIEVVFYGVFLLAFSVWYLFFDRGGQLGNCYELIRSFGKNI